MMARRVEKIDRTSVRVWYGLVAGAAFVALLAALVHVVNKQVTQAQLRRLQDQAVQTALSRCAARHSAAARGACIAQLNAGAAPTFTQLADVELRVDDELKRPGVSAGQPVSTQPAGSGRGGFSPTTFVP